MNLSDKSQIRGKWITTVYDTASEKAQELENKLLFHINAKRHWNPVEHHARYQALLRELKALCAVREYAGNNLIATVGRSVLAQRLANTTTYDGIINYGALGSGSTTPANGDTTLETEVFRKVTASASFTDNVAFIDFFYSKTDTDGTYEEFGTVIGGTASADTGQLFTHALTGGWVKTSSESMTVAVQYDID